MPPDGGYPGVYVEEVPGGPRAIDGVPTSICAFVGRAARGPVDTPVVVTSFADFQRRFGGLWSGSMLGSSVRDFFRNGGSSAIVVRVFAPPTGSAAGTGRAVLRCGATALTAADPGAWGNALRVRIDHDPPGGQAEPGATDQSPFTLTVHEAATGTTEVHRAVTVGLAGHPRDLGTVLAAESDLVRVVASEPGMPQERPDRHADPDEGADVWGSDTTSTGVGADPDDRGSDGDPLTWVSLLGATRGGGRAGVYALDDVELFNLLVIPPYLPTADVEPDVLTAAHEYCRQRRAILLVDGPSRWRTVREVTSSALAGDVGTIGANAALYFPRLRVLNPLHANQVEDLPAAGAVAGIIARTDAQRGVWKAPAGAAAALMGHPGLSVTLTVDEIAKLTQLGVNCLRVFPSTGPVVWGARTAADANTNTSEWRYLPVRRTALFIEESLDRGTRWAVFESNSEPLWAALRSTVGAFLDTLFRQGAFQGARAQDAYLVKCDQSTTTQANIDQGIVNIVVGFAPLKPGEFVILRIQQAARRPLQP